MRKFILLFLVLFLTTGCTTTNLNNMKIGDSAEYVIENNTNLYNVNNIGYRYYLPRGFNIVNDVEYNQVLSSGGYRYYMYVDIVSYYNNIKPKYTYNGDAYLSEYINKDNKSGYLEIKKREDGLFYIEMLYNYAKIEVVVREQDLKSSVINISYILSSVRYNRKVIENKIDDGVVSNYKTKTYKVDKPNKEGEEKNILDYVKEYDKYNDVNNEIPDTDVVGN